MKITINEAMVLEKQLKERLTDLKLLRNTTATKTTEYFGYENDRKERIVEPQYDMKIVDKKITFLQNAIYLLDAKIKQINATTDFEVNIDVENLLSPLE